MINNEVKQRVKRILETSKFARDCDRLLISKIWEQDISLLYDIEGCTAVDMLDFLSELGEEVRNTISK